MSYAVKEIFLTLQGEGAHAGRAAVFCRFTGCNLWSGREADRQDATCQFCDTDFVGTDGTRGARYPDAEALAMLEAHAAKMDREATLLCKAALPEATKGGLFFAVSQCGRSPDLLQLAEAAPTAPAGSAQ